MAKTLVEAASTPWARRPTAVADAIAWLQAATEATPEDLRSSLVFAIEADGTWRAVYYRDVTPEEKLAQFLQANPDVQALDVATVTGTMQQVAVSQAGADNV